jgi:phenylalanyl-tRNA synthetase beta chain
MLISQNWLKEFVDFSCTPHELEHILTMLGLEVEKIHNPAAALQGFVVGEVLTREKHPNADKLSVCTVKLSDTQINTIVCGAPNVAAGQKVPVATEGAVVPNGGFVIAKRKLRGVESNGMICSRSELGFEDNSDGIWPLPADAPVGMPLADYLGMNDVLYEISITPNRADCLSHLGVAREIAAYFNTPLRKPLVSFAEDTTKTSDHVAVRIDDPEVCWRFAARVIRGVKIQDSPEWLQARLNACGQRPINNVVDVTNYVMLECGKPIHAFDLDRVADRTLIVKRAAHGEKFTTLDGKERTLDDTMTIIADSERSSGLAGIMGGQVSEIESTTVNVCIESAIWHPSHIRRTAKKLGITTDAAYRFERGVDMETVVYAADRAAQLIAEIAGGSIASEGIDLYPTPKAQKQATVRYARANMLVGKTIPAAEQRSLLERLGCVITSSDEASMTVVIPTHRVDVETETDLIEEIARLYGYDNIEPDLTSRINLSGERTPEALAPLPFIAELAAFLRSNGFHETMTQNMIDHASAALFTDSPVRIANPLGEELSCMRPSLVPSMLKVIERNVRYGQKNLRLFELGTIFSHTKDSDSATSEATFIKGFKERQQLVVALTGAVSSVESGSKHWSDAERMADVYDIKGVLEGLVQMLGIKAALKPATTPPVLFSPNTIELHTDKTLFGWAGELSKQALKHFDIEPPAGAPVLMCVVNLWELRSLVQRKAALQPRKYKPVSAYPVVMRDVAFVVDAALEAETLRTHIAREAGQYVRSVELFDVFAGATIGVGKKSLAFALQYNSDEKTLADEDVEASIQRIIASASEKFGAVLRG